MKLLAGFDIGGSKIAGGVFSPAGELLAETVEPTPGDYAAFLQTCRNILERLESATGTTVQVGVGIAGRVSGGDLRDSPPSMPFLRGKSLRRDLAASLNSEVRIANDANCMAFAEAIDGAGEGFKSIVGLIIGTGVGSGFVREGKIEEGVNGMAGEIGHLPLPFRDESDAPPVQCGCGQKGCIEQSISGGALARLYFLLTGKEADARTIAIKARTGDREALSVLDRYFETVAKAMVAVLHSFDPEAIVVSGGMNDLPGFYDEVPKRWGKYAYIARPETRLLPAKHGPMSGMRGASWLWRGSA